MTATLAPWAPTIEDIEAALDVFHERWGVVQHDAETLQLAICEYADVIDHTLDDAQADEPYQLWRDLPPSQAARLSKLVDEARERAFTKARAVILAELLEAARTFAAEHPDASRPEGAE